MDTNYTRVICGGFLEAKKLLVLELKEGLEEKKISPERIDEIFRKFGYRGPSVRQILEDPVLMTGNFASGEHLIGFILGGSWDEWNEGVEVSGKHIRPLIKKYLDETPGAIEKANAEF